MTHREIRYQKESRPRTLKKGGKKEGHLRKRKITGKKQGKGEETSRKEGGRLEARNHW
jgi:hypothetical protein